MKNKISLVLLLICSLATLYFLKKPSVKPDDVALKEVSQIFPKEGSPASRHSVVAVFKKQTDEIKENLKLKNNNNNKIIGEDEIKLMIQQIQQIKSGERERWMRRWPEPKNLYEKLILSMLSTNFIPAKEVGTHEEILNEVGSFFDSIEDSSQVSGYLQKIANETYPEEVSVRAVVFQYNSAHAVDYKLRNLFIKDLTDIRNGEITPSGKDSKKLFDALIGSGDISYNQKLRFAEELVLLVSEEDRLLMKKVLEEDVMPLTSR